MMLARSAATPLAAFTEGSLARRLGIVLLGSWVIAASAWISVPMWPVPMTMQTCAILVIAALAGRRLAAETVSAYLLQGAIGLPVLASGNAGLVYMAGPTGGFLLGFLVAAIVVGWMADRGWTRNVLLAAAAIAVGHLVINALGVAWLTTFIGFAAAVQKGAVVFLVGAIVKTALAALFVRAILRGQAALPRL